MSLEVLAVASEVFPLVKTGGLADVAGALPGALAPLGVNVRTLLPAYRGVADRISRPRTVHRWDDLFGGPARLLSGKAGDLRLLALDAPHLFDRPGGPYVDEHGRDWPDNAQRFAALGRAGADIGLGLTNLKPPSILHLHDWQAGLTAAYLTFAHRNRPGMVATVHNLAFQGQFDRTLTPILGLPWESFTPDGVEYYGGVGFLKAALRLADRITTVSPTYAGEICLPENGMGLDGLLRGRSDRLTGIINGIDTGVWDPAADPLLAAPFHAGNLDARTANRAELRRLFALDPDAPGPLFGVVSRLSWQKGLDLLLQALPVLLECGGQLALLGAGDKELHDGFAAAAAAHPGRIGCIFGYDEAIAHRIQAGADVIMVPSRFEPCGLTQLCALRYGAVPLVARVGGLNDTIIDASPMALTAGAATGVQFHPVNTPMLEGAIRRTASLFAQPDLWRGLQVNGMTADVSWTRPAEQYAALYRDLVAERAR
jgi:starch synthase